MKLKYILVLLLNLCELCLLEAEGFNDFSSPADSVREYYSLGLESFNQKEYPQAELYFRKAYGLCTANCDSLKEDVGIAVLYQREQGRANEIFKELAKKANYPKVYRSLGFSHMVYEEWTQAIVYFNEYLKHFPEDNLYVMRQGYCYQSLGYNEQAIRNFEYVFPRVKEDSSKLAFEVSSRLGELLYGSKKYQESIVPLKLANALKEDVSFKKKIGQAYFNLGKYDSAAIYLMYAEIALPRDYEATLLGAWCQYHLGSSADAFSSFEAVILECSDSELRDRASFGLVDLCLKGNNIEKAREVLEEVSRSSKKNPLYHYYFGKILYLKGQDKGEVKRSLIKAMAEGLDENKHEECFKMLADLGVDTLSN